MNNTWWKFWQREVTTPATESEVKLPQPNETWYVRDESPWPRNDISYSVRILDVKDGWVRYSVGSGRYFNDERKTIASFLNCYQPGN